MVLVDGQRVFEVEAEIGRYLFAVHHVRPGACIRGRDDAAAAVVERYKRWVRARVLASDGRIRLIGVLEPSVNVEGTREVIQIGLHAVAAVRARNSHVAKKRLKSMLQTEPDPRSGVLCPLQVKPLNDDAGGLHGALAYLSKSFEVGGVVQRVSFRDRSGRRNTRSLPLTLAQEWRVNAVFRSVAPHARLILVQIKRVHGRLRAIE